MSMKKGPLGSTKITAEVAKINISSGELRISGEEYTEIDSKAFKDLPSSVRSM